MDEVTKDCGALAEAVVFLNHFNDMPDPRQRGKVMYPLAEVLLLPNPSSISPGSVA